MTKAEMRELIEALADEVKGYIDERLAAMPKPERGEKGADGLSGKDGRDGADGKDGAPGKDGERGADGAHGRDGKDGLVGKDGADGRNGKDGRDGVDGKSVTVEDVLPAVESFFKSWALENERRATDMHLAYLERLPKAKDGADGLGVDDFDVVIGDGEIVFTLQRGEQRKEKRIAFPDFRDRGVYRQGEVYKLGNGVTFGGSWWIAQANEPPGKPGDPDSGWRLAVKKGRDGRDGGTGTPVQRGVRV